MTNDSTSQPSVGARTLRANGIDIRYLIEGDGPWVAMSHSLTCDLHMWDRQAATLVAAGFRVLRYDTRGHGGTSVPSAPYTLDAMAEDLRCLLDALGIAQTHFVGLSMGGMIGMTFALKHPARLLSLVLSDTSSRYPADAAAGRHERIRVAREQGLAALVEATLAIYFTPAFRSSHPDLVAPVAAMIRDTPVEGFVGCSLANMHIDVTDRLHTVRLPTLVMVGEHDSATTPQMARAIHAAIPGSGLTVIARAAHLANVEQPEAFDTALLGFLRRVAAQPG